MCWSEVGLGLMIDEILCKYVDRFMGLEINCTLGGQKVSNSTILMFLFFIREFNDFFFLQNVHSNESFMS